MNNGFPNKNENPNSPAKWEHGYNGTEHTKNMGLQGIPANFLLDTELRFVATVTTGGRVKFVPAV